MSDNPFSEPDDERTVIRPAPGGRHRVTPPVPPVPPVQPPSEPDADRTVIRPAPGGRRPTTPPPAPLPVAPASVPRPTESPVIAEETRALPISVTPLAAAAAPLLELLARLRNTLHQPDAGDLRQRIVRELHSFERRAREAGIPMEQLRPAHVALCASIDDVVLNTPWGAASDWASRSLLTTLHGGARGRDPLFELLQQLRKDVDRFRPAIELLYLCVSLGFTSRSGEAEAGAGRFDRLREETYALIAAREPTELSPLAQQWRGVAAPYQSSRGGLPVWVVATLVLAVSGGLFVWVSSGLNAASDDLQAQVLAASPARMPQLTRASVVQPLPPPPPTLEPTIVDQLQSALKPEIDSGLVTILGTAATPIVRIANRGMFAANSASVQPTFEPLLDRIAVVFKDQKGSLKVICYTDNQPIRTVQFPSNFQLSTARAQAVRAIVARTIGDAGRVSAEGRADADPIASNTTPAGREQNRRIEIVLRRED